MGSNITAFCNNILLRLCLMIQVAIAMRNMRAKRPVKPKITPDKVLFCRKAFAVAGIVGVTVELIEDDVCPPAVIVEVKVVPSTDVTKAGVGGGVVRIEEEDDKEEEDDEEEE